MYGKLSGIEGWRNSENLNYARLPSGTVRDLPCNLALQPSDGLDDSKLRVEETRVDGISEVSG